MGCNANGSRLAEPPATAGCGVNWKATVDIIAIAAARTNANVWELIRIKTQDRRRKHTSCKQGDESDIQL